MREHLEFANKPLSFFEKKRKEYFKQKEGFTESFLSNEKLLKASYLVALIAVRFKSPHTIAENSNSTISSGYMRGSLG